MKTISAVGVAALCAVTLGVTLTGCSSTTTEIKTEASSAASAATSAASAPTAAPGPEMTIADYVDDNKIAETRIEQGDAAAPTIDFPMPADWQDAGDKTPEWAYGAIYYDKAKDPSDPPFITAIFNKLTGNVDPAKILEYAPGLLQNLPGYEQDGEVQPGKLGGFDAIQFQGSYLRDDVRHFIAQQTVVIPGKDGAVFVLQLNAGAPADQSGVVLDAAKVIEKETKITV
jgi:hypothetical protein